MCEFCKLEHNRSATASSGVGGEVKMADPTGFEPVTSRLTVGRSAAELRVNGWSGKNRTYAPKAYEAGALTTELQTIGVGSRIELVLLCHKETLFQ